MYSLHLRLFLVDSKVWFHETGTHFDCYPTITKHMFTSFSRSYLEFVALVSERFKCRKCILHKKRVDFFYQNVLNQHFHVFQHCPVGSVSSRSSDVVIFSKILLQCHGRFGVVEISRCGHIQQNDQIWWKSFILMDFGDFMKFMKSHSAIITGIYTHLELYIQSAFT